MEAREFEGKNEQDAIDKAIEALGLDRDEIEVEVVESVKSGFLFRGGIVKIRVYVDAKPDEKEDNVEIEDTAEHLAATFIDGLVEKMGLTAQLQIISREENRIELDIQTESSGILIGKKGKTLEAIQLLTNIYLSRRGKGTAKVIIDIEKYRDRREKKLVLFAQSIAEQVQKTGSARTLDAMNPFERRLIHTSLNDMEDIETVSEGEGLYKRIKIQYTGRKKVNM